MIKWLKRLFTRKRKDNGGWVEEGIGIRSRQTRKAVSKEAKEWML